MVKDKLAYIIAVVSEFAAAFKLNRRSCESRAKLV